MSKQKSTKQKLFSSVVSLILCICMLLGTTFAWFTDNVTSSGNIIKAGNLKIDMKWAETLNGENTIWNDAEGANSKPVFNYDNWEPGYTVVRYIKVSNEGNLAFKYLMSIIPNGVVGPLAEVIDVQYDIVTDNSSFVAPAADNKKGSLSTVGTLDTVIDSAQTVVDGVLLPKNEEMAGYYSGEIVVCVSLRMQESAGNEYQDKSVGDSFDIRLFATQYAYESDSFGNLYDLLSDKTIYVTQSKMLAAGATAVEFSLAHEDVVIATLSVPASAIADTSKPVIVTIDGIDPSKTIDVGKNTRSYAYDINVTNLKKNLSGEQLVTVVLTAPNALPSVNAYHKGALIESAVYDEVAGTITFKTASFSPYAVSYMEYEVRTVEELREFAVMDDVNIKLMKDLEINLDPNASVNDCDEEHFCKLTGSYEYYNGVNINGKNIAVDLNGHDIVVSGDKDGDTVGAVFFIMPNSNLNITDSVGGGMIKAADPCYIVWAPYDAEYGLSYVDVYGGIFASHSYAGDQRTPGYFAMFYAGEGGLIDVYGGYYLYDNESYVDKNGVTHENVNNGAFNVMNSVTTKCITIHDGVMLINKYYRQDGYNSNNKNADHDSIFLADNCKLLKVSQSVTIEGATYNTWYQVQTTKPARFETVFKNTDKYIYRVGNQNNVTLGSLFKTSNTVSDDANINVTVTALNNSTASGTYKAQASATNWKDSTIDFNGTGPAKITINGYELVVEVVDATNATSATNATKNNVVLLKDCSFSALEVSGGYTLYGNGFTMTCSSDSAALDMGYSFVTLNNGTLDNVQIVCPNYDYAALYKSNLTSSENRSETTDKTRYFNAKSAVMASGNSQILNSRISGARAAVNVSGGNVVIDNSRIELGAVASVLVGSANSLTLKDTTLIQKPTVSTYKSSETLMGFSVLYLCDSDGNATPTTIKGGFVQQAWIDADDAQYVPTAGKDIISAVLKETEYLHDIDRDGTGESLNLGFAYMPEEATSTVAEPSNITDNRTDKATIPYEMKDVKVTLSIFSTTVYVYSYKNTKGTADSFKTESKYVPNKQSDIISVSYADTAEGLTTGKSYSTDGWVYELNVDLDKVSGYALDFSKISMAVNGVTTTDFKVNGASKPTSPITVTAGGTTYKLTATIDGKEYTAYYKVTGTETSKESPSLVAANYAAGLCVASSYGGTWHGAAPALEGIQIKYWSVAEKQYKTINLSDYTPTTKGQLNGTNTTWTYSPNNGDFTLTLTGGQVHSGNSVNAMPVVCDGKLYFVASSSKGLVNSGNSARTVPVSYVFKDNNNGTPLTFSHTWSIAENKDAQYNYSDFCKGTLTKLESCVTPDTLITLADGSQVRVDSLTGDEMLLVWNMETGALDSAPIMFVDSESEAEIEVIKLHFSDGTEVKVISEHGFWDYDLNRYVYLDRDASRYIGHTFAKHSGDNLEKVELVDVVLEIQRTTAWSPVTAGHLCYFVNGMLSMPGGVGGLFNIFEVDAKTMTYDYESIAKDIETYGLFTYEEVNAIAPLSEEMFYAAGGQYLKISIGKGNLTIDELKAMITRYSKFFS